MIWNFSCTADSLGVGAREAGFWLAVTSQLKYKRAHLGCGRPFRGGNQQHATASTDTNISPRKRQPDTQMKRRGKSRDNEVTLLSLVI